MGQIQQSINQTINTATMAAGAYQKIVKPAIEAEAAKQKAAEINKISLTDEEKVLANKLGYSFKEYKEMKYDMQQEAPEEVKEQMREQAEVEEIEKRQYDEALKYKKLEQAVFNVEKSEDKMKLANSAVSPQLKQTQAQKKSFNRLKDAKKRRAGGIKF